MKILANNQRGSVLVTTMIITGLLTLTVTALLMIVQQQNYLTARSQSWSSEIPIAEAGIEEAMAHLNSRPTKLTNNGWSLAGTNYYVKARTVGDGYYYSAISVAQPRTITSVGYARTPLHTNYTSRKIYVTTKLNPPVWGIIGKQFVSLNGTPYIDSFNSSDSRFSTGGLYDPAKRSDRAGVGSPASSRPAISTGSALIYGFADTGPGGTVTGNVGDGEWLAANTGQQAGHVADDFNMAIPDVAVPIMTSTNSMPAPGVVDGLSYNKVLTTGNYVFDGNFIVSGGAGIVATGGGTVRVYFKGNLRMTSTAAIRVTPGTRLEFYLGGDMDLNGKAVINTSKIAANCTIYGLPGCTSIKYTGDSACYAKIYAPQAAIEITGDSDYFGSMVGNSVKFTGTANIHYDEALGTILPQYHVAGWEEF
jgi:hypothetical protein